MKRTGFILFSLLVTFFIKAQKPFRTIVPQTPIMVGEAFQVQYVLEDGEGATNFITPVFRAFATVTGPDVYSGAGNYSNNHRRSKNYVFTLVALKPGKQLVPGTYVTINGEETRSNNAFIEVLPKQNQADKELAGSDYYLRPGEDVQQKIKQNLFVKVQVDKKTCIVGEPVVATFKLYSRLESKSDIVKNPGFYGFSVLDMINLSDRFVTTENINGKAFDVHTIRKVQLYPLQAGVFTIDAMEINNKVEFSRSMVRKKTEQEIVEGVLNNEEEEVPANTEIFENEISTAPVAVLVKPVPEKTKPAGFSGATGNFSISAAIINEQLAANEEGILEISIAGKGNFIQLNAPVINWPAGIEGFEPVVKDSLDVYAVPLKGKRKFRYAFVASAAGTYTIPAVSISFFNTDTGVYKTVTTKPQQLVIGQRKQTTAPATEKEPAGSRKYWIIIAAVVVLIAAAGIWLARRKKTIKPHQDNIVTVENKTITIEELLPPTVLQMDGKDFYKALHQAAWHFFGTHYRLSGTGMNKETLFARMSENGLDRKLIAGTAEVLQQCETGMFTNVAITEDRELLYNRIKGLLLNIEKTSL